MTLAELLRSHLTPDLLRAGKGGHCYVASEAYYHLVGGLTPMTVRHEGTVHWFLRASDGSIVDLTADQFRAPVPYGQGRGRGFLTRKPSKRAVTLLQRAGLVL